MDQRAAVLGVIAGVVSSVGAVAYMRDVVLGRAVPHRGAWLVWMTLGCVALAAQIDAGAGWSAAFLWVEVVGMGCTLALAVPWGVGGARPAELTALGLATAGVIGWQVTDSALWATVCVCLADAVGFALMMPKAWRDPWSETVSTYLLAASSGSLTVFAVGTAVTPAPELVLYPAWFAVANGLMSVVLSRRRLVMGARAARHAAPRTTAPRSLARAGTRSTARATASDSWCAACFAACPHLSGA